MNLRHLLTLSILFSFQVKAQSFFDAKPDEETESSFFQDKPVESLDDATVNYEFENRRVDIKKDSPWSVDVSATARQYRPNFAFNSSFSGGRSFNQKLLYAFGPVIDIGRDFYLSERISTSTRIHGFYSTIRNSDDKQADPTLAVSISKTQEEYQNYGAGISQTVGYDFYSDQLIIRPFAAYSVGYAVGTGNLKYDYNIGADVEAYNVDFEDRYVYNDITIGVRFITESGLATTIQASRIGVLSGDLQLRGYSIPNTGAGRVTEDADLDSRSGQANYSASIGVGYYF